MRAASSLALLTVLLATPVARADSCEPDDTIRDARGIEAALARCECVAAAATSTETKYAALCCAASYAFRRAEPEGDRSSDFAKKGMALADRARCLVPDKPEGHFKYALCLGIYLRENNLAAVTRVDELITVAKRVIEVDEKYERGGAHRLLALLYAEAPRLIGPGDRDKARHHLARLLALAGDDEENRLVAVNVHHEIGEDDKARALLARIDPERGRDENDRRGLRRERDRLRKALED